jgi:hypothetical protein
MFNWLKSLLSSPPTPAPSPANVHGEPVMLDILAEAMHAERCTFRLENGELILENGLAIAVEYLESQAIEGGMRTSSRTICRHPEYFPDAICEFQHASGVTEEESLLRGCRTWIQTDLTTLKDAIEDVVEACLVAEMTFPFEDREGEFKRKIFMGPYIHSVANPEVEAEACESQCHDFCPCCLFTQSYEAFTPQLQSQQFFGLRLYTARYEDGTVVADCRVNGEDYPLGVEYLLRYAESWPQRGAETRKQYVAIRTLA